MDAVTELEQVPKFVRGDRGVENSIVSGIRNSYLATKGIHRSIEVSSEDFLKEQVYC